METFCRNITGLRFGNWFKNLYFYLVEKFLKTSVRVFCISSEEIQNVSRTVFNTIFRVLDIIFFPKFRKKITRTDEKMYGYNHFNIKEHEKN